MIPLTEHLQHVADAIVAMVRAVDDARVIDEDEEETP